MDSFDGFGPDRRPTILEVIMIDGGYDCVVEINLLSSSATVGVRLYRPWVACPS